MTATAKAVAAAAATAAFGLGLIAALSAGATSSSIADIAANGCHTALGLPATSNTTIAELAGTQAADVAAAHPSLAAAHGWAAIEAVDTLNQLDNWRDLDRGALAGWVVDPRQPPPDHAIPTNRTTTAPPASAGDLEHDYLRRCQQILDALDPTQRAHMAATPRTAATPTRASRRVLVAAAESLGRPPAAGLAALIADAITPGAADNPASLLWTGPRVAPAAVTAGDLVFFDFTTAGPTHVAVALDATTVATTMNLDGHTPGSQILTRQPQPTTNVVIIRPNPGESEDQR